MLTIAFWNLDNHAAAIPLAAALAHEHTVDVLVVAECLDPMVLLAALNARRAEYFLTRGRSRAQLFTRFPERDVATMDDRGSSTIRLIAAADWPAFLLAAAHLPSPREMSVESRNEEARQFAQRVAAAERDNGLTATVVLGDLNLNPFDAGLVQAGGFHAVADRRLAAQEGRVIQGVRHPFFYNPMWRFFGDAPLPAGSCFYWRAEHAVYFWNIYDQVLLRPALLPAFRDDGLLMPTTVAGVALLNGEGRPDRTIASDHLPIVLRLDL